MDLQGQSPTVSAVGLRVGTFIALFSIVPTLFALSALIGRSGSQAALAYAAWIADAHFIAAEVVKAAAASLAVACVLGITSLWAWHDTAAGSVWRTARLVASFGAVAMLLYPGIGSWIPGIRRIPWALGFGLVVLALLLVHLRRRARYRELALTAAAILAFFFSPSMGGIRVEPERPFDARDVFVIGFDSVSADDVLDVLRSYTPRHGTKIVYENASTPIALTSSAWRALLSGRYPGLRESLPGVEWPTNRAEWLPAQLAAVGYRTRMSQDSAGTNTFGDDESVEVRNVQGWKAIVQEFVWKSAFPQSVAASPWLINLFGGPADVSGRYGYSPGRFWTRTLDDAARAARTGPILWSVHSCYSHAPIHVDVREAMRVPGWWRMTPVQLEGAGNPFTDDESAGRENIATVRVSSLQRLITRLLDALDSAGILGSSNVFLLSDHGPRGDWVPARMTNHVMLAAFVPGPRKDELVSEPVSLVDIAPTIRALLHLPVPAVDGRPLPIPGIMTSRPHKVLVSETPTLGSLGIQLDKVTGADVQGAIILRSNGTFAFTPDFWARVSAQATDKSSPQRGGAGRL